MKRESTGTGTFEKTTVCTYQVLASADGSVPCEARARYGPVHLSNTVCSKVPVPSLSGGAYSGTGYLLREGSGTFFTGETYYFI